jgi:hypothetical protein
MLSQREIISVPGIEDWARIRTSWKSYHAISVVANMRDPNDDPYNRKEGWYDYDEIYDLKSNQLVFRRPKYAYIYLFSLENEPERIIQVEPTNVREEFRVQFDERYFDLSYIISLPYLVTEFCRQSLAAGQNDTIWIEYAPVEYLEELKRLRQKLGR